MKRAMILVGACCIAACSSSGSGANGALPPVTMLSPDSANHQLARFSPDGKRVYWWELAGISSQLWTAAADLGNPAKVPVTALGGGPLFWSPDGSKIAVGSSDSSLIQVAVIPAAGGAAQQLTKESGLGIPSGWNPDGDRISYIASAGSGGGTFQTFVTSVSHPGRTPLVADEKVGYFGVWSPDGKHVAIGQFEGSKNTIWVADSAGRHPRQLTTDGFEVIGASEWVFSPDSKWIVYESRRTGTSDIWIVPVDSGAPRQLTRDIRNDWNPVWSPDGKWIAFLSDRGKQTDVWAVSVSGGQELRVTDDASGEDLMQWLSPTRFAYLTGMGQSGIWSMSLTDSTEKRLTPDSIQTGPPRLSPDGKQVAFRIERGGGQSDIALMPVAGGPMRTLVQGGNVLNIRWSPDGSRIAYQSDRGGTNDIWVVDAAGGAPRQLENWPGNENQPVWSADGATIYFMADREARLNDIWKVAAAGGEPVRVTNQGSMNGLAGRRGRPEVYGNIVNTNGVYAVVQVKADGSVATIWDKTNAFPADITPTGDSLVIASGNKGAGGFSFLMIPASGAGAGRSLLKAGEGYLGMSDDGMQVLYTIPSGATTDIGILNRKDGTTRQLTKTPTDEGGAVMTPDGKTVLFQRSRTIRRIAIADLTKLLAGAPK